MEWNVGGVRLGSKKKDKMRSAAADMICLVEGWKDW